MKYNELPRRFTLLELIIVVAVIGILLSMLLPSLHKSKIIAMKALCLSNTNQVHKILIGNIHNHNGRIYYHKSQNKAQNPWDLPHPMYKELGEPERDLFYCPLREERNRDDRWNFRIWKVTGYSMMWKRQRGIRRSPISYEWVDYPARIESPDENPLVADTVVKVRDKFSTLDDKRKPIYSSHFPEGHRDQNKTYTDGHGKLVRWGGFSKQMRVWRKEIWW